MSAISPWVIPVKTLETATIKGASGTIKFGYAVGFNGQLITTRGAVVRGIVRHEEVSAGQDFTIVTAGEAVGFSAEAIASSGLPLAAGADSRIVIAQPGDFIIGRSDQIASAANRYFRMILTFEGFYQDPSVSNNIARIVASGNIGANLAVGYDLAQVNGAGEAIKGIAAAAIADGTSGLIYTEGTAVPAISGAAFTVGTPLMVNAAGKFVTATASNHVEGRAVTAATGADEAFSISLTREGILPA